MTVGMIGYLDVKETMTTALRYKDLTYWRTLCLAIFFHCAGQSTDKIDNKLCSVVSCERRHGSGCPSNYSRWLWSCPLIKRVKPVFHFNRIVAKRTVFHCFANIQAEPMRWTELKNSLKAWSISGPWYLQFCINVLYVMTFQANSAKMKSHIPLSPGILRHFKNFSLEKFPTERMFSRTKEILKFEA